MADRETSSRLLYVLAFVAAVVFVVGVAVVWAVAYGPL